MLPSHFITARNIGGNDVYNFVIVFKSIEVHILFTTYILSVHFFISSKQCSSRIFIVLKFGFFLIFDSWCGVKALKIHYCDNTLTLLIFFFYKIFKTVSFKYFHFILFLELVISKTHDNGGNNALIIFSH